MLFGTPVSVDLNNVPGLRDKELRGRREGCVGFLNALGTLWRCILLRTQEQNPGSEYEELGLLILTKVQLGRPVPASLD